MSFIQIKSNWDSNHKIYIPLLEVTPKWTCLNSRIIVIYHKHKSFLFNFYQNLQSDSPSWFESKQDGTKVKFLCPRYELKWLYVNVKGAMPGLGMGEVLFL